jgi:hypothetical protein
MKTKQKPEPWPPIEFALPNLDTLEEISRGEHVEQQRLFPEPIDDSRAARLARILAGVPGVQTADRLPPPGCRLSGPPGWPLARGSTGNP